MSDYVKTEHVNIVRDMDSTALINKDINSYEQYKLTRQRAFEAEELREDVSSLKSEISELKQLILNLSK
jgi:hypothetical protein